MVTCSRRGLRSAWGWGPTRSEYVYDADKRNLATVETMWRREVEAAHTYRLLAEREHDPKRRDILIRLADQESRHAARWAERIAEATGTRPDPKHVERGLTWFQRLGDPNVVLHRLEQEENKAEAEYDQLLARLTNPLDREIAQDAMNEERDHAVVLRTLAGGKIPTPRSTLDSILRRERWHVRGTGWIGDAIYGVNDGLGAVFGIVSAWPAIPAAAKWCWPPACAGTLASALSMGAGAYLASKSEREVYESEVARERAEIEEDPHEETARARALLPAQRLLARRSARDGGEDSQGPGAVPAHARARRARASPKKISKPVAFDALSPVSTAIGGFIPIIPFFFTVGMPAVIASFIISTLAHFAVGAAKSLVTTRSWWASGAEMTMVGVLEAAVTYGVGLAFARY